MSETRQVAAEEEVTTMESAHMDVPTTVMTIRMATETSEENFTAMTQKWAVVAATEATEAIEARAWGREVSEEALNPEEATSSEVDVTMTEEK
jgi:hypothetical protein